MVRVGCCGYSVSKDRYWDSFDLVEVQQTFYHPPAPATTERWRREAPEGFEYSLKAWQLITHEPSSPTYRRLRFQVPRARQANYGSFRQTEEVRAAWKTTEEVARSLKARVIVFQCPATFRATEENVENLRRFFSSIRRDEFLFAWEPRGQWGREEILKLCNELDLIYCLDPLKGEAPEGDLRYFRLHGTEGYKHRYTEPEFEKLKGVSHGEGETYVLFNNISMFEDASRFKSILGA